MAGVRYGFGVAIVVLSTLTHCGAADDRLNEPAIGLGIMAATDYADISKSNPSLPKSKRAGGIVLGVLPHSPAALAGVKPLDIIVTANGKPIPDHKTLVDLVKEAGVGSEVALQVAPLVAGAQKANWGKPKKVDVKVATVGENAKAAMELNRDDIRGVTFAHHRGEDSPRKETGMEFYFQVTDGKAHNLRVIIRYNGEEWIFCQGLILHSGEVRQTVDVGFLKWDRDVLGARSLQERADVAAPKTLVDAVLKVLGERKITVRMAGKDGSVDRVLETIEQMRLQQVLDAYQAWGGSFPDK